ncbi:MAG: ABC transporter permease [Desulfobacterales bacterium]|nr:ABC transporter permease [Desulfobacterales bacterium]
MKIRAIMINTFREAIRDKVLYSLLFFALLMIGGSILLGRLTIGENIKIIKDMGLASISIFGMLIAIFVGIGLVYKEIDKKTIYTVIAKPVHRYQFLLGKYLGLILTLLVEVAIMSFGLLLLVLSYEGHAELSILKAILLIFFELMTITAVAILFSSFSTPILSGLFTLAVYIVGHLSRDLLAFGAKSENAMIKYSTAFIYYSLPNLDNFNIKGKIVHQALVSWEYLSFAMLYGVLYISITLLLSMVIFQKRDFR